MRRLTNVAFTPRRVAAMECFVRELSVRFVEGRLSSGQCDLVRALAWDLPALVIFRVLGIPDEDVVRVKAGAESRLLLMWGDRLRTHRSDWCTEWRRSGGTPKPSSRILGTISRATSSWHATATCQR